MKKDRIQHALRLGVVDQPFGRIHVVDQKIFQPHDLRRRRHDREAPAKRIRQVKT